MIMWKIYFIEFAINKEGSSDIKKELSFICEILCILRKIFENMAAESGSLLLKVGEFTCMCDENCIYT
jgi:hypothetical protein